MVAELERRRREEEYSIERPCHGAVAGSEIAVRIRRLELAGERRSWILEMVRLLLRQPPCPPSAASLLGSRLSQLL